MKQYVALSDLLYDNMKQADEHMDISTDQGATPYERVVSQMVASRCLSLVSTLATELNVMVRAGKLNQEALDPLDRGSAPR